MQDQIWPTIVTLAGILAGAAVLIVWIIRPRETAAVLNAARNSLQPLPPRATWSQPPSR